MENISGFKGLEVIIVSLGGILCIYLGYRILVTSINQPFKIFSDLKGWKLKAANISPGIFLVITGALVLSSPVLTNIISILQKERFINTYATKLILDELRKKNNLILDYRLENRMDSTNPINKDFPVIGDSAVGRSGKSNKAVVACNLLHVRRKPGVQHQIVGSLRMGDIITVKEARGFWLRLSTDKLSDGWIDGQYVKQLESQQPEPAKSLRF